MNDDDDGTPVLMCLPDSFGNPGGFDDDIHGHCSRCGVPVHWRPHNPPPEIMPRVCILCFEADLAKMPADDPIKLMMTKETVLDLVAFAVAEAEAEARKRRGH